MIAPGSRIRQIGWALVLATCFALLLALTFKVNAVKSEVRLAERHIIAAARDRLMLETEFETRSSQRQLADWNQVEFGYAAPRADQYLENERQLAALGTPRGIGAPAPVRVALNEAPSAAEDDGLLGGWLGDEETGAPRRALSAPARASGSLTLAQRLARPTAKTLAAAEVAR